MAIPVNTTTLVDASTDATGTATITDSTDFHMNRLWVFFTNAATVHLQASPDGSNWVTLHTINESAEAATLSHPFENLRVSWTGNNGTLDVKLSQFYDNTRGQV